MKKEVISVGGTSADKCGRGCWRTQKSVGRRCGVQVDVVGLLGVFFDEEFAPHGIVGVGLNACGNIDGTPRAVHLRESVRLAFGSDFCQAVDGDERCATREGFFAYVRHACWDNDSLQRFAISNPLEQGNIYNNVPTPFPSPSRGGERKLRPLARSGGFVIRQDRE